MPRFLDKLSAILMLVLAASSLSACTGTTVGLGAAAAGTYFTKPDTPPEPDLSKQIPQHESWCYETLGYPECYARPQDVEPDRLINVDPPSNYPLTPRAYNETVIEKQ